MKANIMKTIIMIMAVMAMKVINNDNIDIIMKKVCGQ